MHTPGSAFELAALLVAVGVALVAVAAARSGPLAALIVGGQALGLLFVGGPVLPLLLAAIAGALAMRAIHGRPVDLAWAFAARQAAAVLAGYTLYELGRIATESAFAPAYDNARGALRLERDAGLPREASFQSVALHWNAAVHVFNAIYTSWFLPVTAATLVWLLVTDRPVFRLVRDSLGISAVLAVLVIAVLPVAPPRLVPESGLLDTVTVHQGPQTFANQYAAIPSLHVGWLVLCGWALARSLGLKRPGRWLVAAGPGTVMAFTVVATGNHLWIDGVVGTAFALGPALVLADVRGRRAPVHAVHRLAPRRLFGDDEAGSSDAPAL